MNIDKFKHQHVDILAGIADLRRASHAGISANAAEIARLIVTMSSSIKLHLAVEDQVLYPALRKGANTRLAAMGQKFQTEMDAIATAYMGFAGRWNQAAKVAGDPEGFLRRFVEIGRVNERLEHKHDCPPSRAKSRLTWPP